LRHCVFSAALVKHLELLYKQLYPQHGLVSVPPFYTLSGRALVCGEVMGSVMNATSSKSTSIVMAYWPDQYGDIGTIDYSRKRVGCVQYYCKHYVNVSTEHGPERLHHIFAYVHWKERHSHENYFGTSATVCQNSYETPSKFSFIPIQRIFAIGAHCTIDINASGYSENVFVSAPIPMRLSL